MTITILMITQVLLVASLEIVLNKPTTIQQSQDVLEFTQEANLFEMSGHF